MPATQINVEYWFRLLYECLYGTCYNSVDFVTFVALLERFWFWIVIVGYALSVLGLCVIVYTIMRLFNLRKREELFYSTLLLSPESKGGVSSRWQHIESLAGGTSMSEWREAIIEADIMLDDMLTKDGYVGAGVGEKLKAADPENFHTLQDAWEVHKVRNQIAHEGSAFNLSEPLARRTIARYANVFREFKII